VAEAVWKPGELRVLVVDDEPDVRLGLRLLSESVGATVRAAANGEQALETAHAWRPHLVVSDVTMGRVSGIDLLRELRRTLPETRVVLVTGYGTIELAVTAMGLGASHFVTKPFDNEDLLAAIRRFGSEAVLAERAARMDREKTAMPSGRAFIAEDPAMRDVLAQIDQVAPTDMSVLIRGESGVGKELVARTIHERSRAAGKPFLPVNTAALPDNLLEAELFGHTKGAFTGADRAREGIFAQARGGTVFLDEIGLMSIGFQGKLLRVLQERAVVPLGSVEPVPVEFRLVSATSRDLHERMARGEFHEDLYYRLQVFTLEVPGLRGRPGDIRPLARHFLEKYAREAPAPGEPTEKAWQALEEYAWPGNVRELENCIHRALVLSGGGAIRPEHLGLADSDRWSRPVVDPSVSYEEGKRRAVHAFQRRYLERALRECEGNVSAAARRCGLTRAAVQRIMRAHGLTREQFR